MALYSFIIVDDESEIREGIRDTIPWEELGYTFAGACANGFEALELAERILPDVALTDINMPFMDGLAFADRLVAVSPFTKVLIITGYDDFEYARKAVQLQVYDYIVKPVTPSELRAILAKLKLKLDEERAERTGMEQIKSRLAESLPLLRERFLNHLIAGREVAACERIEALGLSLPARACAYQCLVLSHSADKGAAINTLCAASDIDILARRNIIEKTLAAEEVAANQVAGVLFQDPADALVILLWGISAEKGASAERRTGQVYQGGLKTAELLYRELAAAGFRGLSIGAGEPVEQLDDLQYAFKTAAEAVNVALLRGQPGLSVYRELLGAAERHKGSVVGMNGGAGRNWGAELAAMLKTGDQDGAAACIDGMVNYFRRSSFSIDIYHVNLSMTLAAVIRSIEDMEIPIEEVFSKTASGSFGPDPFTALGKLTNLDEVRAWFYELTTKVNDFIAARRDNFARVKVREALEYLEANYSDTAISLAGICKKIGISMSYFGACFKKQHDKTFVEELTAIRMKKAMELLVTTDMLTYEIAEKIGYHDPHYFSLSFRKYAGMTTTEYRSRNSHAGK